MESTDLLRCIFWFVLGALTLSVGLLYWYPKLYICPDCSHEFKPTRRMRAETVLGESTLRTCPTCARTKAILDKDRECSHDMATVSVTMHPNAEQHEMFCQKCGERSTTVLPRAQESTLEVTNEYRN